jgi:hypothetical protein
MKSSKSFVKFFGPAVLALAALQPACLFGRPGPSAVGQGQAYRSGDANFDQFFTDLHTLQVEMASAPKQEKENRIALAKKLGIELEEEAPAPAISPTPAPAPAATPDPAVPGQPSLTDSLGQSAVSSVPLLGQLNQVKNQVSAAKAQVDQMRTMTSSIGSGVAQDSPPTAARVAPGKPELRAPSASLLARSVTQKAEALELKLALAIDAKALEENEVKTELRTLPHAVQGDGRTLAEAVHDAARSELRLYLRMQKAKRDLDKLQMLAGALDNMVDASFRKGGASKKSEVRKNLDDARALIKLMQSRADDVSGKAKEVVEKLGESASAKLEPESAPEMAQPEIQPEPAKPEPSKAKRSSRSRPVADFVP